MKFKTSGLWYRRTIFNSYLKATVRHQRFWQGCNNVMERQSSISTCTSVGLIYVVGFAEQRCFGLNIAHGAHNNNGSGHAASQGKRGRLASPTLLYSCRNRDSYRLRVPVFLGQSIFPEMLSTKCSPRTRRRRTTTGLLSFQTRKRPVGTKKWQGKYRTPRISIKKSIFPGLVMQFRKQMSNMECRTEGIYN